MIACERVKFNAVFKDCQPIIGDLPLDVARRMQSAAFIVKGFSSRTSFEKIRDTLSTLGSVTETFSYHRRFVFVHVEGLVAASIDTIEKWRISFGNRQLEFGTFTLQDCEDASSDELIDAAGELLDENDVVSSDTSEAAQKDSPAWSQTRPIFIDRHDAQVDPPATSTDDSGRSNSSPPMQTVRKGTAKRLFSSIASYKLVTAAIITLVLSPGLRLPGSAAPSLQKASFIEGAISFTHNLFTFDSFVIETIFAISSVAFALASVANIVWTLKSSQLDSKLIFVALCGSSCGLAFELYRVVSFWLLVISSLTLAYHLMRSNEKNYYTFFEYVCVSCSIVITSVKIGIHFQIGINVSSELQQYLNMHTHIAIVGIAILLGVSALTTLYKNVYKPSNSKVAEIVARHRKADTLLSSFHISAHASESSAALLKILNSFILLVTIAASHCILYLKAACNEIRQIFRRLFSKTIPLTIFVLIASFALTFFVSLVRTNVHEWAKYLSLALTPEQRPFCLRILAELIAISATTLLLCLTFGFIEAIVAGCEWSWDQAFARQCFNELCGRGMRLVTILFLVGFCSALLNYTQPRFGTGPLFFVGSILVSIVTARPLWELSRTWLSSVQLTASRV